MTLDTVMIEISRARAMSLRITGILSFHRTSDERNGETKTGCGERDSISCVKGDTQIPGNDWLEGLIQAGRVIVQLPLQPHSVIKRSETPEARLPQSEPCLRVVVFAQNGILLNRHLQ